VAQTPRKTGRKGKSAPAEVPTGYQVLRGDSDWRAGIPGSYPWRCVRSVGRATLVALLCLLLLPASAAARRDDPKPSTPLSIALAHAFQLWGAKPCSGHYRVELVVLPEWATGHADWESHTGLDLYTSPPSTWTGCVMQLQRADRTQAGITSEWAQDCTTVLHEWGHSLAIRIATKSEHRLSHRGCRASS